jgi:hypothetical protein
MLVPSTDKETPMSPKTILYLSILFTALVALAVGGWLVKGARAMTGQTRRPGLRPRVA